MIEPAPLKLVLKDLCAAFGLSERETRAVLGRVGARFVRQWEATPIRLKSENGREGGTSGKEPDPACPDCT